MKTLAATLCIAAEPTAVLVGARQTRTARDELVQVAVARWAADRPRRVEIGFTRSPGRRLIALALGHHATFLLPAEEALELAARLAQHREDPLAQAIAAALQREVATLGQLAHHQGSKP